MTTTQTAEPITADDFGPARHGVHIFENEWGDWFAYGHHSVRRIAAALNHEARENGGALTGHTLDEVRGWTTQSWGTNVRRDGDEIRWDDCATGTPGAFPYTVVRP